MLMPKIRVTSTDEDVGKYQNLLLEDWSRQTVTEVLSLLAKMTSETLRPNPLTCIISRQRSWTISVKSIANSN